MSLSGWCGVHGRVTEAAHVECVERALRCDCPTCIEMKTETETPEHALVQGR